MTDVKNIFRLRKEGELDDALVQARELFDNLPNDPWVIRAYAWVLYDKLKMAYTARNSHEIKLYTEELAKLTLPDGDDILIENVGRILRQGNPREQKLRQASELDYAGDHPGALRIFREIRDQFSDADTAFHTAYAWSLYKYLKDIVPNDDHNKQIAESCLEEYFHDLHPEKPSLLHSLMMNLLIQKLKDRHEKLVDYGRFIISEHFRPEDFLPTENDKQIYPALYERVIQNIGKSLYNAGTNEQISDFQPLMDDALARYGNNIWLFYFKAKMLIKTGKSVEAESFMVKVVRQKRNEFWAWALLGDIHSESAPEKSVSCYCKSLLCNAEEKYLINTRLTFGKILKEQGFHNEARTEIDLSIRYRQEFGYSVPGSLRFLTEEDWYRNATGREDNHVFYETHQHLASSILLEGLPALRGNVISLYTRAEDRKAALRARILVEKHQGIRTDLSVRVDNYKALKNIKKGAAITIWLEENDRPTVIDIERRESKEPFDLLESKIGIVDHINPEKRITHIMIDRDEDVLLPGNPGYKVGDCVTLKTMKGRQPDGKFPEVLHHQPTDLQPSLRVYQPFSGTLKLHASGSSGKAGAVFVGKHLLEPSMTAIRDGINLTGYAVIRQNRNTGKWEWNAISIEINA